ncbi:hypothetical protein BDP27DRAFT_1219916, partial [Rhodocollybia butyracea]
YVPLPIVVKDPDSDELISNLSQVKKISQKYWSDLYQHDPTPNIPKPWLTTPALMAVKDRLCSLLAKGNLRPAPGPDEWEKWIVKNLSDPRLTLVLTLINFIVEKSTFPGKIKDVWLSMFHKCGMRTDLLNWRGILLSNFIANIPMSWLNACLVPYVSAKRILPDTQVATQKNVQTRDLMSYLAGIKCFDYLAPEGFYDLIISIGLPTAIIDLDRAAQTENSCVIRTAHGNTEPIILNGLTKQGGPLSPIKSTLTTAMGHHYLNDLVLQDPDALIITTENHLKGDPHLPHDNITIRAGMTEATDDLYIFSRTLPSLKRNTLEMEPFQFAYGWLTQWRKTNAYVLNPEGAQPDTVTFDSVTNERGVSPLTITTQEVPLIRNKLEFLCAKVDDPDARFEQLKGIIEEFTLPRLQKCPPITLL